MSGGWRLDWRTNWRRDWRGPKGSATIPGSLPEGVGAFSLDLLNGYTVTYRWPTGIDKSRSGKEQRVSRNDHPKEFYSGSALLFDPAPAQLRAQMARQAVSGQAFQLGLPHEEVSITASHSGTTVYVTDTTKKDWMNPGQRVIVRNDRSQVSGVIQSTTATSITLDINPGTIGDIGGAVMPSMPIYLEPEQAFPRYPTEAELWNIEARAAVFDFARALASLALGPLTACTGLDNATITQRSAGTPPYVAFAESLTLPTPCEVLEQFGTSVIVTYRSGVCTPADVYARLSACSLVVPTGTWGSGTLAGLDSFASTQLSGGALAGPIGTGATITTYAGYPVWDRELANESTITDSIQAGTEVLDYGGLPYSIGAMDQSDWGRAIQLERPLGAEFQWFKLFMATVKGRQNSFWLPTWRDDLPCVATGAGTITVTADLAAWWYAQRAYVQIQHAGGISYANVSSAANNGDGTWTLQIGMTLTGVTMVSWLELARFTNDDIPVTFTDGYFYVDTVATVTPAGTAIALREFYDIGINDGVTIYRHCSGSRDTLINGNLYTALAMTRDATAITMPGQEKDLILTLPIDHPLVLRYPQAGQSPNKVTVTVYQQQDGGALQTIWVGDVENMNAEGRTAKFHIPSRAGVYMLRSIPSTLVAKTCPHMLYDSQCQVSRAGSSPSGIAHKQVTTAGVILGREVYVDLPGVTTTDAYRSTWANYGELYHPATGERQTIMLQTDQAAGSTVAKLTLSGVIVGMKTGDTVEVYAGCGWTVETCSGKFNNRQNMGGFPALPYKNPFIGGIRGDG